jgi:L-threonylcarbamoyladenylate synthase
LGANNIVLDEKRNLDSIVQGAADCILRGGVILYPTDTIYGIGCDAFNHGSIERIFKIKERSPANPALMIVSNIEMLEVIVDYISPLALKIMEKFWPGPLTLLFKPKNKMSPLLISNDSKIGVRIPDNLFCLKLSHSCGVPIVSTSANLSGAIGSGKISDLKSAFGDSVDLIIDNGDSKNLQPSTVLDVTGQKPIIVREGSVSADEIIAFNRNF